MLVPENLEVLSLRHWVEYQSNARYNSIENNYGGPSVLTFVCAGSLYTGNELEKCLILVFMLFSHFSLSGQYVSGEDHTFQELFECPT